MPRDLRVAMVEHWYPGLYHDPGRWGTRDGVIPWKVFELRWRRILALQAQDRVNAVRWGSALLAKEQEAKVIVRKDYRESGYA